MTVPVEAGAPPSTYAIADVIEGKPGAWSRTLVLSTQRAFFIAPGLFLAGIRGPQLVKGALLSSATITAFLLGIYSLKRIP